MKSVHVVDAGWTVASYDREFEQEESATRRLATNTLGFIGDEHARRRQTFSRSAPGRGREADVAGRGRRMKLPEPCRLEGNTVRISCADVVRRAGVVVVVAEGASGGCGGCDAQEEEEVGDVEEMSERAK
ncbi:unnamed protein product [Lampetra fluviatilis]